MKQLGKYILVVFLSSLFFWVGGGGNYVIHHCLDCHSEIMQEDMHCKCVSDVKLSHSHNISSECQNEDSSHFLNSEKDKSHHHNGHCFYVTKYILDIQKHIVKIFIPSIDMFKSDLFLLFAPFEEEIKSTYYTTILSNPMCDSVDSIQSSLCIFLI